MDRRSTPFSGRLALDSLRGQVDAIFTEGEPASVRASIANLLDKPGGSRDRQLLLGDPVTVIDLRDGHVFVQSSKDGYCGWLEAAAIGPAIQPTHWVAARSSHLYTEPKVQGPDLCSIPFGSRLQVMDTENGFARTALGFVPLVHLRDMQDRPADPVAVAEMFLGAPYLWGGNSAEGIDCSGLVQAALLACGLPCTADSDQQRIQGRMLDDLSPLQRGDLVFWKGHVAMISGPDEIIHANGHAMAVVRERLSEAIARIEAQTGLSVMALRRVLPDNPAPFTPLDG